MFKVKDLTILNLHEKLIEIAEHLQQQFQLEVVTSCYRPEDKGVHGTMPVRGLDLRCNVFAGPDIADYINVLWQYDPDRPDKKVALYHRAYPEGGWHLHLQVHDHTRRKDFENTNGRFPT